MFIYTNCGIGAAWICFILRNLPWKCSAEGWKANSILHGLKLAESLPS